MKIKDKIIRLKNNKSILNGTLFSLFSVINSGISFFLLLILASYITPPEYGYLSLFSTVLMVLGYFRAMSTEGYISIAYFKEGKNGIKDSVSCMFFLSAIFTVILAGVFFMKTTFFSHVLSLPEDVLFITIFIAIFTMFVNVLLNYIRIKEKVALYGFISCGNALLNFILSILFVKEMLLGWQGRVYAQLICCIIFGTTGFLFFCFKGFVKLPNKQYCLQMLCWGIPLIPHAATNFVKQGLDRYIINYNFSIDEVGLFSFAFNIVNIIIMIGDGFNQSNSVEIFKVLGDKKLTLADKESLLKKNKNLLLKMYTILPLIITPLVVLLLPFFFPKYCGAIPYIIILSFYAYFLCIYLLYTNFLFYYKKTKNLMYITVFSALLHFLLSLLLTKYSLYMTCGIYCLSQAVIILLVRRKAIRELKLDGINIG